MVGRSTYLLEWTKNGRLENGGMEGIDEFQSCPCNNRFELFRQGSNEDEIVRRNISRLILQLRRVGWK